MKGVRDSTEGEALQGQYGEAQSSSDTLGLVFRFRYWLHLLIFGGAFAISWATPGGAGAQRVWLALPEAVSAHLNVDLRSAIIALTVTATVLAIAAAMLRTWGAAYLGQGVVFGSTLNDGRLVIHGPYRFLRNPLYLGTLLHTLALSVLMTWMGAAFAIVAITALQAALIASEERFYLQRATSGYLAYKKAVPRMIPRLSPISPGADVGPRWAQALAGEVYMWGVAASFAAFGFTYNALLIGQGVLVSFGLSIVVRGLTAAKR